MLLVLTLLALSQASPLPGKIKYDQRQEGKWNIRADLENIVILVIPTSSPSASNTSLLDFFKTLPLPYKKHLKREEAEEFIESKTAPYHVDISKSRSHLAKLHPVNIPENVKEEIIKSPSVVLGKDLPVRSQRAILITVPMDQNIQDIKDGYDGKDAPTKGHPLFLENIQKEVQSVSTKEKGYFATKLEEISREVERNVTVNKAVVLAKVIQAGLVEYFHKLADKLKEKHEAERKADEEEEEEEELKQSKIRPLKKNEKFLPALKIELEPPRLPESLKEKIIVKRVLKKEELDEKPMKKDELLLLGAENEQCGPGQERDSSGICIIAKA